MSRTASFCRIVILLCVGFLPLSACAPPVVRQDTARSPFTRAAHNAFGGTLKLLQIMISDGHEPEIPKGVPEIYLKYPGVDNTRNLPDVRLGDGSLATDPLKAALNDVDLENKWYNINLPLSLFTWDAALEREIVIEVWEDDVDLLDNDDFLGRVTVSLDDPQLDPELSLDLRRPYHTSGPSDAHFKLCYMPPDAPMVTQAPTALSPEGTLDVFPPVFRWEWPPNATHCRFRLVGYAFSDYGASASVIRVIDKIPLDDYPGSYVYPYPFDFQRDNSAPSYAKYDKYGWTVQGYNQWSEGPYAQGKNFQFGYIPPKAGEYQLTVVFRNKDRVEEKKTFKKVDASYTMGIDTAEEIPSSTVPGAVDAFTHWNIEGNVAINDNTRSSAKLSAFASDVTATAVYAYQGYTLEYASRDESGGSHPYTVGNLLYKDEVNLSTAGTTLEGDPAHHQERYRFSHWDVRGGARVADVYSPSTLLREFSSNVTATPVYVPYGTPPLSLYTLSVSYLNENGGPVTSLMPNLSADRTVDITTHPGVVNGRIFLSWALTGTAVIDDRQASATVVRGLGSDSEVRAQYVALADLTLPVLLYPLGACAERRPVFRWEAPVQATSYWLLVSDIPDIGSGTRIVDNGSLTSKSFQCPVALQPGKTYYWKVKYRVGNAAQAWSAIRSFTVQSDTPPPDAPPPGPADPTPPPPASVYHLTVDYRDAQGNRMVRGYDNLTPAGSVNISTPDRYTTGDPAHPSSLRVMEFAGWNITGGAQLERSGSSSTRVYNFSGNASVTANYRETAPPPSPSPSPRYSLTVQTVEGNGAQKIVTHNNLSSSSAVYVTTPERYLTGTPQYPTSQIEMVFTHWTVAGTAALDNAQSSGTTVRNLGSNASVTAVYRPKN